MIRAVISAFLLALVLAAPAATGQDLTQQAVVTTSEATFVLSFFGKVVEGMDVLDKFQKVDVENETPKERIELKKVTIAKQ